MFCFTDFLQKSVFVLWKFCENDSLYRILWLRTLNISSPKNGLQTFFWWAGPSIPVIFTHQVFSKLLHVKYGIHTYVFLFELSDLFRTFDFNFSTVLVIIWEYESPCTATERTITNDICREFHCWCCVWNSEYSFFKTDIFTEVRRVNKMVYMVNLYKKNLNKKLYIIAVLMYTQLSTFCEIWHYWGKHMYPNNCNMHVLKNWEMNNTIHIIFIPSFSFI